MHFFKHQHSLKFRCIAWLAVWAIMLPVGVPLFHHAPQTAAGPLGALHICSIDAKKATDADGKPAQDKQPSCPLCQSLHLLNGGFVPPYAVAVAAVFFSATALLPIADQASAPMLIAAAAWPRAPPVPSQAS